MSPSARGKGRRAGWLGWPVRLSVGVGVVLAAAAFLAQVASSAAPVTITLQAQQTIQQGLDPLIAAFQLSHPQIKVQASYYTPASPQETQVPIRLAAGNGTDLVQAISASSGPDSVWPMSKSGLLADLSKQPWASQTLPVDKPLYSYGGKLRALDLGFSALAVLSYNKDYFASNHLSKPTTFAQLLTLCKTIAAAGQIPIAFGGGNVFVDMNDLVSLAGNTVFSGDKNWYTKLLAHKTTFAGTAGWTRALQMILDMKGASCFDPGVAGDALPTMLSQFGSGQAAMMFTYGGLNALVLKQDPNLHVGMFTPPGDTAASTTLTTQPSGGMGIWSKSTHQAPARTFLAFLAQPKNLEIFDSLNFLMSSADARKGTPPSFYAELKPSFKAGKVVSAIVSEWPNTQIEAAGGADVQGLFTGQKTIPQILADFDNLIKQP